MDGDGTEEFYLELIISKPWAFYLFALVDACVFDLSLQKGKGAIQEKDIRYYLT